MLETVSAAIIGTGEIMNHTQALTDTLDTLKEDTEGEQISVSDIVETMNSRGFGPLLIVPAIITILPTGAIPGIPDICALFIILVSLQYLVGHKHPWLPQRLKKFSFSRQKFLNAVESIRPYTTVLDKYIYPRLQFLSGKALRIVISIICIFLSIAIMIMGFIPFAAALPAAGILVLGLGLSTNDGLLILSSLAFLALSIVSLVYTWSYLFG